MAAAARSGPRAAPGVGRAHPVAALDEDPSASRRPQRLSVGVFWDFDNVPVAARGGRADAELAAHLAGALVAVARAVSGGDADVETGDPSATRGEDDQKREGVPAIFAVYANGRSLGRRPALRAALSSAGAEVHEVPTSPQAADTLMRAHIGAFAEAHGAGGAADAALTWSWEARCEEEAFIASAGNGVEIEGETSMREDEAAALARRVASILDEHPRGLPRLALHEEYERLHGVPYERACRAVEGGRGEAARALQRVCRSGAAMRAASKQLGVSPSAFRVDWVYRHRADALRVARGGSRRSARGNEGGGKGRTLPGAFIAASVADEAVVARVGKSLAALVR
eukprot:PRCOL_00002841-RA